jgi:hypothetical protein
LRVQTVSAQPDLVQASRLRVLLYVALVCSAMTAFFGIEEIQAGVLQGTLKPEWRLAPAAVFSVALALYAVDRVLLVRQRRYPSGRAFFQVAFGLALLTLLLPGGLRDYQRGRQTAVAEDPVLQLMTHADPRVRALAAEVAGARSVGTPYLKSLAAMLHDPQTLVRDAAREALERHTGLALGNGSDAAGRWQAHVEAMTAPQEQEQP